MGKRLSLLVGVAGMLAFSSSAAAAPPNKSCAACTPPLVKIGGATAVTQVTPTLDLVFWGSHWSAPQYPGHAAVMSAATKLFFGLSNNTGAAAGYNNILKQYLGPNYVPFYGGAWVDTRDPPASLTSADLAAEAVRASQTVALFSGAGQNVQFVIFPEETTVVDGRNVRVKVSFAGEPDPNFCAYHDYRKGTAVGTVVYDVEPWTGGFGNCLNYGNGPTRISKIVTSMTTVATHEYAEAATDPFWNSTTGQKGWQTMGDANLFEIGDLCAYPGVNLPGLGAVQYLWSNAANAGAGACVTSG